MTSPAFQKNVAYHRNQLLQQFGADDGKSASFNPEGIPSFSPWLRDTSYHGDATEKPTTLKGLKHRLVQLQSDTTLSGLLGWSAYSQGSSHARNPGLNDGIPSGFPADKILFLKEVSE